MAKNKKENSEVTQSTTTEGKKPFDKAKWRKMKYGHREKVDKWKNRCDVIFARVLVLTFVTDGFEIPHLC